MTMLATKKSCAVEFDRGPDWLFARLVCPAGADVADFRLAEVIWQALEQQFLQRVVIEMEQVEYLRSVLIGQIVLLHKRITSHGGLLRLSGMSPRQIEVLHISGLEDRFPAFSNREQAVMGRVPTKPR
jgi:anti-anti-sigma factor